jgi:hypothetical protein
LDDRSQGGGVILEASEQALGLLQPSLAHPQITQLDDRRGAVWVRQRCLVFEGGREDVFGLPPLAGGDQKAGVYRAAPGEQRQEAAALEECRDRPSPVERALGVGQALAGGQGRAAGIADCQRVVGFDAGGDRHRLVQERHPRVLLTPDDLGPAGVAESGTLEGDVPDSAREFDSPLRLLLGLLRCAGSLRALDVEPHPGRAVPASLEQASTAAKPAVCDRGVARDPILGREEHRHVGGGVGITLPLVFGEGFRP